MIVVAYARTMAGAKRIEAEEPPKRPTPRRDRLSELSRQWQARQQARQEAPPRPAPEPVRIPKTDLQLVIAEIAERHRIPYGVLLSKSRSRRVVDARDEAIAAVKLARPMMSLPQIGRLFGGKDHTTILAALRRAAKRGLI